MNKRNLLLCLLFGMTTFAIISCSDDDGPQDPGDTCQTDGLTYTNYAAELINSNCATSGCHSEGTVTTFEMHNFETVSISVGFNRIIGSINHDEGFSPMPKLAEKLSDCNIEKMTAWIRDGAPE